MDEAKGCSRQTRAFPLVGLISGAVLALALMIAGSATARTTAVPTNTSPPTISGTAQQGQTLTASTGSWSGTEPITFAYQWQRCDNQGGGCGDLKGSTSATYTLQKGDVNRTFRVVVTAKNNEGANTAVSSVTGVVTAPAPTPTPGAPVSTSLPTIAGSMQQGQTLTASTGGWSGNQPITFSYVWQRCDTSGGHCGSIGGTNHATYELQKADVGRTLRVAVTAKNSAGTTTATSAQTGTVAGAPAPSISANVSTFRAVYGTWVTLSGSISARQGGEKVAIEGQAYGSGKSNLGTAITAADGSWSFRVKPGIQTLYDARWGGETSRTLTVGVMPLVTFHLITHKRFSTRVVAARSFAGKLVKFQRLDGNRWVTLKRVRLGANSGAIFRTRLHQSSRLRMAFSVNQAGPGYLGGVSRTLVVPQL